METLYRKVDQTGVKTLVLLLMTVTLSQAAGRWMKFSATAYTIEGETASGKQTREGRTIAADPAVLPLGTKVQVKGAGPYDGVYVVHDSGRKINGREIDIYIENNAEAKRFGKKPVQVKVLSKAPAERASAARQK